MQWQCHGPSVCESVALRNMRTGRFHRNLNSSDTPRCASRNSPDQHNACLSSSGFCLIYQLYYLWHDNSAEQRSLLLRFTMSMNRDEAERAYVIGKKHEQENALEKAHKFYQKSLQLHHSEEAAAAVIRVRCHRASFAHQRNEKPSVLTPFSAQVQEKIRLSSTTAESDGRTTTHMEYTRETTFTQESASSVAQYTLEQVCELFILPFLRGTDRSMRTQKELVNKIRASKDFYEILGVHKECNEDELKKAYKKVLSPACFSLPPSPSADSVLSARPAASPGQEQGAAR